MIECKINLYRTLSHLLVGVYFFCVLAWPEFIKLQLFSGFPGLTATRLALVIIFPFVCHRSIQRFKFLVNDSNALFAFLISVFLFLCLLLSVFLSDYSTSSVKPVFFVLENTTVFGLVLYLFYDESSKEYYLKILLLAVSVVITIGVLEWIEGGGILESFLLFRDDSIDRLVSGQTRSGMHRLSSVYLNPLSFAVHLLAFAPIMVFFLKSMKGLWWGAALVNLVITPFLVFGTDSRVAIVLCLLVYAYFGTSYLYHKSKNAFVLIVLILLLSINIILLIDFEGINFLNLIEDRFLSGQGRMSSVSQRVDQYSVVANEVTSSVFILLFGLGFGAANEIVYPLAAVDNIYLSILLEGGLLSSFALIFLFFCLASPGLFCRRSPLSSKLLFSLLLIYAYLFISSSLEVFSCVFMLFVFLLHERKLC